MIQKKVKYKPHLCEKLHFFYINGLFKTLAERAGFSQRDSALPQGFYEEPALPFRGIHNSRSQNALRLQPVPALDGFEKHLALVGR